LSKKLMRNLYFFISHYVQMKPPVSLVRRCASNLYIPLRSDETSGPRRKNVAVVGLYIPLCSDETDRAEKALRERFALYPTTFR